MLTRSQPFYKARLHQVVKFAYHKRALSQSKSGFHLLKQSEHQDQKRCLSYICLALTKYRDQRQSSDKESLQLGLQLQRVRVHDGRGKAWQQEELSDHMLTHNTR